MKKEERRRREVCSSTYKLTSRQSKQVLQHILIDIVGYTHTYTFKYIYSHISPDKDNPLQFVSMTQVFCTAVCRIRTSSQFHPVVTYVQQKLDTTWRTCLLVPDLCACDSSQGRAFQHGQTQALQTYGMRIWLRTYI